MNNKKHPFLTFIFVMAGIGISLYIIMTVFMGTFNELYIKEAKDKISAYACIIADNIENEADMRDISKTEEIFKVYNQLDEPHDIHYTLYLKNSSGVYKITEDGITESSLPDYWDMLESRNQSIFMEKSGMDRERGSYSYETNSGKKYKNYISAAPVISDGEMTGIVEISISNSNYFEFQKGVVIRCITAYFIIFDVTFIIYLIVRKAGKNI